MVTTHAGRVDACPGTLDLHAAADGELARMRVPGGFLPAAALEVLAGLIETCAGGWLELTSRGNLGIRSVSDPVALRDGLAGAGLLAGDPGHDRVRNILASPLSGLAGGPRAQELVAGLDTALLARTGLTALSGRFLFGIDDGSGLSETPDLALTRASEEWQLTIEGRFAGVASVADLVDAAAGFLTLRGDDVGIWRVRELPGGAAGLAATLGRSLGGRVAPRGRRLPLGRYAGNPRVLVVAGWLQRVSAAQLRALGSVLTPAEQVRVSAAGRIVVPIANSTAASVLAASGLLVDADDPRGNVTACSGLGACSRATVDVRSLAAERGGDEPLHLVSCPRACGAPADARVEVLTA